MIARRVHHCLGYERIEPFIASFFYFLQRILITMTGHRPNGVVLMGNSILIKPSISMCVLVVLLDVADHVAVMPGKVLKFEGI